MPAIFGLVFGQLVAPSVNSQANLPVSINVFLFMPN